MSRRTVALKRKLSQGLSIDAIVGFSAARHGRPPQQAWRWDKSGELVPIGHIPGNRNCTEPMKPEKQERLRIALAPKK